MGFQLSMDDVRAQHDLPRPPPLPGPPRTTPWATRVAEDDHAPLLGTDLWLSTDPWLGTDPRLGTDIRLIMAIPAVRFAMGCG
jgi:hypothetical protein